MSREASSYLSFLLCAAIILNAECASNIPDRCLELVRFDVDEIENHLSGLNLTDVPTVKMMTAGFKCPISVLPFGTLKSDWARLLLLREAQPDRSIVKLKLLRLMRILIIAYYQMEERIDVTDTETEIAKKSLVTEATTNMSAANEMSQSHCPSSNNSLGVEISSDNANHHCSCTDSLPNDVTRLATDGDCPRMKLNATVIETMKKNASSPSGTTTVVSADATRPNVTSSIDLGAATTYYPGNARKAALKVLGNCLKQSLKDIVRRQPDGKVFEIAKDKARHSERATRKGNEIDNRTVLRITPPTNEFWRYVTFPTKAPAATSIVAPAYRMRELSRYRTGQRKPRKRVKLNNDLYESFRRFYGVDKNEEGIK